MVLQLRTSQDGEGCYAMIPPSVHPDGDQLEWINNSPPTETNADAIVERFGQVAALAALARFYPSTGGRDEAMMSLVGCAVRADWDQERIEQFIRTLCRIVGDNDEVQMRVRKAANTIKRKEGGRKVRGIPGAAKSLGIPVEWMRKIAVWVGWAQEAPVGSEPAVFVSGVVRDVSKQAWNILADYEVEGDPGVYQYGEALARVDRGRSQVLNASTLKNDLNRCAVWVKMENGKPRNTSAPASCVEDMLSARASEVTVPELKRVATVPMFTRDGRLLNERGFDEESGIFLDLAVNVDVPHDPTQRDVREALKTLWYPISNFPFEHRSDRAHAIAMMLEPYMRDMFGPTPMYFVSKPAAGTGATLFIESALFPTLMAMPPVQTPPKSDEEMKKTLTASLLEGDRVIFFDNANGMFSPALVSALTAETYSARILGASQMVRVPIQVQWVGSGNNTALSGELYRRVVDIRFDAKVANPEDRHVSSFRIADLKTHVQENAPDIVRAACVIIQYWVRQGMPRGTVHKASYETWASIMSGLFDCINVRGFGDTPDDRKPVDPELDMIKGIVRELHFVHRGKYDDQDWFYPLRKQTAYSASELELMVRNDVLDYDPGPGSITRMLPRLLGRYADRVFDFDTKSGSKVSLTLKRAMGANTRWYVTATGDADDEMSRADVRRRESEDVPF